MKGRLFVQIILFFIKIYKCIPLPNRCIFHPTCSIYARDAFIKYGVSFAAMKLVVCRLLRCHPFYKGSLYDPVS